jgi:predicted peroxiredoxin
MKLGILVNTDRHLGHIVGIAKAALAKGHEVIMFAMGDGTRLLGTPEFTEFCRTAGVSTSFCEYNAQGLGVPTTGLPPEVVGGSQYHNATMNHNADRVIIL